MMDLSRPLFQIIAIEHSTGNREEITDLYWFEENFVHSFDNERYDFEVWADGKIVYRCVNNIPFTVTYPA